MNPANHPVSLWKSSAPVVAMTAGKKHACQRSNAAWENANGINSVVRNNYPNSEGLSSNHCGIQPALFASPRLIVRFLDHFKQIIWQTGWENKSAQKFS
jgi:hypothetical protein